MLNVIQTAVITLKKLFINDFPGIGIDDMFVIIQCWNNLPDHEKHGRTLQEKIALTMQHAGVAITVTSVTDVLAFGVGAITVSGEPSGRGCNSIDIQDSGWDGVKVKN